VSLLGLDIGTTGCKAIVFREGGAIVGAASREYGVLTQHPGWAEQDPEAVWRLAWSTMCEAVAAAAGDPPRSLAISCQGEAVIPVDARGRALRPAILGMDTRTTSENAWLVAQFGRDWLFRRTGMPVHTINTLPKLLWLQQNEPDVYARAARFALYEDFVLQRLVGEAVISHCLASRTQMYALAAGSWDLDILSRCDIDATRLARLAPPSVTPVGQLTDSLARELGVKTPVLVASGGHDQACAAVGSGTVAPGAAMVSTGSAEVVETVLAEPMVTPGLGRAGISVYRHVVPGRYLAMTLNQSGGMVLRWFRDELGHGALAEAKRHGESAYDVLLGGAPDGPTSLLMLPHLAGSGTPWLDTASRGAFVGLSFATTQAEMAKAILEGLCFELRANLDLLQSEGMRPVCLYAVGGGARSALWLQLKADICGLPLKVPRVTEAACLGAALLGGVSAGLYSDLAQAVAATVQYDADVAPDYAAHQRYSERYQLYQELYARLGPLLHRL